jgi:hypothetical protein
MRRAPVVAIAASLALAAPAVAAPIAQVFAPNPVADRSTAREPAN